MNQLVSGSIARLLGTLERFMDTRIEPNSSGLESMTFWLKTSKTEKILLNESIHFGSGFRFVYASSFKPVSYTKFGHGQPNKRTAFHEDCVGLSGRYGFRMDDKSCELK